MYARFLKIGQIWGQDKRVKAAMTTQNGTIPKLFGLRKDHKTIPPDKRNEGPLTRPVCGASASINGPLSHLVSEILNKLADNMDKEIKTECRNTEEMIAELGKINHQAVNKNFQVWSSDVKALYPSLKVKEVIDVIGKEYRKSNLDIDVDDKELALYLALTLGKETIEKEHLQDVTSSWLHEGGPGRKPGITTAEVKGGIEARSKSKFQKPLREPTQDEKKKMISIALQIGIETITKNHLYTFNGNIYQQTDGGPIGLELTGAISRVYMLWWDREFKRAIRKATSDIDWSLYMYMRYVDDTNCVRSPMPPGARIEHGKVVIKQELIQEDLNIQPDLRTARIMKEIANTVSSSIQVEIDCPSMHDNNMMPLLDLEVGVRTDMIVYQYYRKPMANSLVLLEKSAMPMRMKRVCLIQEVIRILRNTKRELHKDLKTKYLSEFAWRMKESGYSAQFRQEVIECGVKGYEKQVEKEEEARGGWHHITFNTLFQVF